MVVTDDKQAGDLVQGRLDKRMRKIEVAAKALAWDELSDKGKDECTWDRDFSDRERDEYRRRATVVLMAIGAI